MTTHLDKAERHFEKALELHTVSDSGNFDRIAQLAWAVDHLIRYLRGHEKVGEKEDESTCHSKVVMSPGTKINNSRQLRLLAVGSFIMNGPENARSYFLKTGDDEWKPTDKHKVPYLASEQIYLPAWTVRYEHK